MDMFLKTRLLIWLGIVIILGMTVLQIHNALHHPIDRGFDATAHIPYIKYVKETGSIPLASEGFEFYQAPIYYLMASLLPNLYILKISGVMMYLLFILTGYIFFRYSIIDTNLAQVGAILIAIFPVMLYMSISIGNEFLSALFISISLVYYLLHRKLTDGQSIILGGLLALSIATKATSFVLVLAIIIDQFFARYLSLKKIISLTVVLLTTISLGGGYYIRNYIVYRNPFIAPDDLPNIFTFNQPVVVRNLEFFTTFRGFFNLDLFLSHHYSILSGTYFSWFYDAHNIVIPVQQFSKAGAVLTILSFPVATLTCIGFFKSLKDWKSKTRILPIYTVLLLIAYVAYNFRLPYYSTVKGSFILSLAIPFGYFFLRGLEPYTKFKGYLYTYLILYTLITIKHFWIFDWWY